MFASKNERVFMICVVMFCGGLSAAAEEIRLSGGDVIHGTLVEETEDRLVIDHPDLGRIAIDKQRIAPAEAEPPAEPETPEAWYDQGYTRLSRWAAGRKEAGWGMSFDLSMTGAYGNTDEQSLRAGTAAKRTRQDTRLALDAVYYNRTQNSHTTDNKFRGGVVHDWLLPESRWFYFAGGRYDYDDFESWRHRASGHAGPGYRLFDTEMFWMDLRTGPGARKEWGSQNDDVEFEGAASFDLEWKITPRQTLTALAGYYPVLTDTNDYRTRSGLNWRFLMDRELNLSLLFGLEHEYMNLVDRGKKHNDTRVFMGVRCDF